MSDKNRGGSALTKASILMLLSAPSMAATYQPITQCWDAPTEREDGTPLAESEIRGYTINLQIGDGEPMPLGGEFPATTNCVNYTPTAPDQACFTGTTIDTGGRESALAEKECKTPVAVIAKPKPQRWRILRNIITSIRGSN